MIDVRELQVGSYVLDVHKRLIQIRDIDGQGIVTGFTILGEKSVSDTDDLQPVLITANWLERFRCRLWSGNRESVATYTLNVAEPTLAFMYWHGEGEAPPTCPLTKVYEFNDQEYSRGIGSFIATAKSVHHLQQLVYSLEHVWLTLTAPEQP